MIPLPKIITAAGYLLPALAAAALAWWIQGWRLDAAESRHARQLADIALERETERREAAEEAARRLLAAQEAERQALAQLAATKTDLATTRRRLKEALHALPTANHCGLSADARGLLNRAISSDTVPEGAAQSDRAAATAPADPGVAEADLGAWIADAVALYGECRARIEAIRQWDERASRVPARP